MAKQFLTLLVLFGITVSAADIDDGIQKKRVHRSTSPRFAGIGMVAAKHTCTLSYEGCLSGCKDSSINGCAEDCDVDCSVCALDFGEATASVCNK